MGQFSAEKPVPGSTLSGNQHPFPALCPAKGSARPTSSLRSTRRPTRVDRRRRTCQASKFRPYAPSTCPKQSIHKSAQKSTPPAMCTTSWEPKTPLNESGRPNGLPTWLRAIRPRLQLAMGCNSGSRPGSADATLGSPSVAVPAFSQCFHSSKVPNCVILSKTMSLSLEQCASAMRKAFKRSRLHPRKDHVDSALARAAPGP
jgi:hypothetical protein